MDKIELAKMIYYYETTVGSFDSEVINDLFSYWYGDGMCLDGIFENWLKEQELTERFNKWLEDRGLNI